jgi:hypothetical protein
VSADDPDLDPRSDRAKASHKLLLRVLRSLPEDYEPWGKDPRDDMARTCADCSCGCVFFNQLSGQLGADWGVCMNPESHRAGLLTWEHQGCHHFRFDEALESDEIEACECEESEALRAQLTEAVEWVEYLAWEQPTPIEEARAWLKVPFRVPAHPAAPEPGAEQVESPACNDPTCPARVELRAENFALENALSERNSWQGRAVHHEHAAKSMAEDLDAERAAHAETRKALELEQKAHVLTVSAASAAFESVKARVNTASLLLDKCECRALSTQIQLWQLEAERG